MDTLERRVLLAVVNWDGGGNGVDWNDANNWDTNTVPTAADDVFIDVPGVDATINVGPPNGFGGINAFANSITSSERLRVSFNSSLEITAASSTARLWVNGGTLRGSGDLAIASEFEWDGGPIEGSGKMTLAAGGTGTMFGTGNKGLRRTFEVAGTLNYTGQALAVASGAISVLTIQPGGVFDINTSGGINIGTAGVSGFLNNFGTVRKSGGGSSALNGIAFNTEGVVEVQAGQLALPGSNSRNAGVIDVSSGATLWLSGTTTYEPGSVIQGPGSVRFSGTAHTLPAGAFDVTGPLFVSSGSAVINDPLQSSSVELGVYLNTAGTLTLNAPASLPTIAINDGTLNGSGDVTLTGSMNWIRGTLGGSGSFTVINTATVNMPFVGGPFGNATIVARPFLNEGVINYGDSAPIQITNATFTNAAGGTIEITSQGDFSFGNGSVLINEGVINKTGAGESYFELVSGFTNAAGGVINVTAGELDLRRTFTNLGTITTSAGTLLELGNGSYTHDAASSLQVGGDLRLVGGGGTQTFPAGILTVAGNLTVTGGSHTINDSLSPASVGTFSGGVVTFNQLLNYPGPLVVNQQATVNFNQPQSFDALTTAGFVGGAGNLTITSALALNSGAILRSTGTVTLAAGATGNSPSVATIATSFVNEGTFNVGGATLALGVVNPGPQQAGSFTNSPGATFNITGAGDVTNGGGTSSFLNEGTINKSGGGESFFDLFGVFTNAAGAVINVTAGELDLRRTFNHQGTITTSPGTLLELRATSTYAADSSITAGGNVAFPSGTHNFPTGTFSVAGNLTVSGGTVTFNDVISPASVGTFTAGSTTFNQMLDYPGPITILPASPLTFVNFNADQTFGDLALRAQSENTVLGGSGAITVTGTFTWEGGRMQGGALSLPAGAVGNFTTGAGKGLRKTFENSATVNYSGSNFNIGGGTQFINHPNATFNIAGDGDFADGGGGTNTFDNRGRLRKISGGGLSDFNMFSAGSGFLNSGSIEVLSGQLGFRPNLTSQGNQYIAVGPAGTITLRANFDPTTTQKDLYNFEGRLFVQSISSAGLNIEAMSEDRGATQEGYADNFAIGTLELTNSNPLIRLVDNRDNAAGAGAEAVYVDRLIVPAAARLDLNGLKLYARSTQVSGQILNGTVTLVADGGQLVKNLPASGDVAAAAEEDLWTFYGRAGSAVTLLLNPGDAAVPPAPLPTALGWGEVELLDPSNNVIAGGDNDILGINKAVLVPGVELPADGTYTVRVSASPAQSTATGRYVLSVYDATVDTRSLSVNTPTLGQLETRYAIDHWTFTAEAGTQVMLERLAAASSGIVFDLTGPNNLVGFTGLGTNSKLVNLTETGQYTLSARGTNNAEGAYRFVLNQTTLVDLPPNSTHNGTIAGSGQSTLFRIGLDDPQPLRITLNDADDSHRNVLYARLGSPPTPRDFTFTAGGTGADAELLVASAAAGDWYVLLFSDHAPVTSSYAITADAADVFVTSVAPVRAGADSTVTLTLTGAGYLPGAQVELKMGATTIPAQSISVDGFGQITAEFDLAGVMPNDYDVVVTNPSIPASGTLAGGFEVLPAGPPQLVTRLVLPGNVRPRGPATFYVEYANTGNTSMSAPLLRLQSADPGGLETPMLTLDERLFVSGLWSSFGRDVMPDGFASTVQFLAHGDSPGVLHPGESVRVPVYSIGVINPSADAVYEYQIRIFDTSNTELIDWSDIRANLRPDWILPDAWTPIADNLEAQVGTTWGDFVGVLSENARELARIGRDVRNADELWGYEVLQASGALSPVPVLGQAVDAGVPVPGALSLSVTRTFADGINARWSPGSWGYGWSDNWESRTDVDADGNVNLFSGPTLTGRFQPDQRNPGAYFSFIGDPRTLISDAGGFTLREPNGQITRFDASGRFQYVEDLTGNRVTASYDGSGRLDRLDHTSGAFLDYAYNAADRVQSITDSFGRTTQYVYDAANEHLLRVIAPDLRETVYTYDAGTPRREHALLTIAGAGVTRTYEYDATSGLLSATFVGANLDREEFARSGGTVTVTDAANISEQLWFDHDGQIARVVDSAGGATQLAYDSRGRLAHLDGPTGLRSTFTWSDKNSITAITDELGHTTRFEYATDLELLRRFIDAKGNATNYAYDSAGNLLQTTYADGSRQNATYDPDGTVSSTTNRRRSSIEYTYNALGQVTRQGLPDGTFVDFTYDPRGRLETTVESARGTTTYTYVSPDDDRVTRIDYPGGLFLVYTYDAEGRRQRIEDQDGFATVYVYDAAGRIDRLEDGLGGTVVDYTYDAAGRLQREDRANGTATTYAYDSAGRVERIRHLDPAAATRAEYVYGYDALGRRTSQQTPEGDWTYTYDSVGQLTRAQFASTDPLAIPDQDLLYEYDALGNRTRTLINGVETLYVANNLNQYTSVGGVNYAYDADGNLTSDGTNTYVWDAENRLSALTTPGVSSNFDYDPFGLRVWADREGTVTRYLIDPSDLGNLVGEFDGSGAVLATYRHGSGLASRSVAGSIAFYELDALGSAVALTTGAGAVANSYAYLPFGDLLLEDETLNNDFEFVGSLGQMREAPGVQYVRARHYNDRIGRFLSPDPIGLNGGDANLYRYVLNMPTSIVDPSGNSPFGSTFGTQPVLIGLTSQRGLEGEGVFGVPSVPFRRPDGSRSPRPTGGASGDAGDIDSTRSVDPNDKIGPGHGPEGWVQPDQRLDYRINFENFGPGSDPLPPPGAIATAPAQRVEIIDQLSADLDWQTLRFSAVGWGDVLLAAPPDSTSFTAVRSMTQDGVTFDVEVIANIDLASGRLRVVFQSLDPGTSLPPEVLSGFLPPEDGSGRGKGFIEFSIMPVENLPDGTEIRNIALITFDGLETIATNQIDPLDPSAGTDPEKEALVTLDGTPPALLVSDFEFETRYAIVLQFDEPVSADLTGATLVNLTTQQPVDLAQLFTLEVDPKTNSITWIASTSDLPDADYRLTLPAGAARDRAGNVTTADQQVDFFILAGDANRDRIVNLADFNILATNFGQSPRTFSQGDFNHDGTVNLADFNLLASRFGVQLSALAGRFSTTPGTRTDLLGLRQNIIEGKTTLAARFSGRIIEELDEVIGPTGARDGWL